MTKWLSGLFALLMSVSLWAEEAAQAPARPVYRAAEPLSFSAVMQLLLGLLLVVAVILALAWLMRRLTLLPGQHRKLRVIAALSLGSRERAVLVQAGDEQLLLGVAQGQVTLLKSFDKPIIEPQNTPESGDFANTLQQMLRKRGGQ